MKLTSWIAQNILRARKVPTLLFKDELEDDFDDQVTMVNQEHNFGGGRFDLDKNVGTIKMRISIFLGKNDLDAYLEWERKVDLIFECHNYSKDKKVKLAIIEVREYVILWWDQLTTSTRKNGE